MNVNLRHCGVGVLKVALLCSACVTLAAHAKNRQLVQIDQKYKNIYKRKSGNWTYFTAIVAFWGNTLIRYEVRSSRWLA